MCSLHPRLTKRFRENLEEIQPRLAVEITDNDLTLLKSIKRRGADEMLQLKNCATAERCLKVFDSPTPTARDVSRMQRHVEEIIKELRR